MIDEYIRNARFVKAIDGDTVELDIDLGLRIWIRQRVRVLGINCPERKGATREAGDAAKAAAERWLSHGADLQVRTKIDKQEDSFGRVLGDIRRGHESLGSALITSGHAVAFNG